MGTITGTIYDDQSLFGTSGNDTINALAGIDWIIGSTGNDRIDGGSGDSDVVMYQSLSAGIFFNNTASQVGNVGANRVVKSGGQQDTLVGVEALHGTHFADKIYMGNNTYVFAEGGNDEIHVGTSVYVFAGSGNDTIYGGVGSALDYLAGDGSALQTRGIVAVWNTATSGIVTDDGWGNTDKFFGIGRIIGSAFSDVMTGNVGNDQIWGGAGDDYLYGNAGADGIEGGDGNDMLFGGTGDDYITGGSGDDSIYGGEGNNWLGGGDGNDVYFVQSDVAVYDVIDDAGGDADILQVLDTAGRDAYRLVYDGNSLMHETAQGHRTEIVLDENGVPVVEYLQWMGSEEYGTDNYTNTLRIITDLSNITGRLIAVAGTDGSDIIVMPNETPQDGEYWGEVYANGGDDNITLSSTIQYITYAGDGNDTVLGYGDTADYVNGDAGNDYLEGNGGDDSLYGGAGYDDLYGGEGNDSLTGEDGGNHLNGGNGNDTLIGGTNDDFINGGRGNDLIDGGDGGWDHAEYYDAASGITVNKSDGSSGVVTGNLTGTDTFFGIEIVIGSSFNDTFNGSSGDDFFTGNNGNDKFYGGDGFDAVAFEKETEWWRDDAGTHGVIVNISDYSISVNINQGSGLQTIAAHSDIDSFGKTDILYNIEMIFGTQFGDYIAGDAAGNHLLGHEGDDTLNGGGGHDRLEGGDGNDVLTVTGDAFTSNQTGSFLFGGDGDDTLVSSEFSSWGTFMSPGLGNNTIIGSVATWNSGGDDDLQLGDLIDVGGITVVQGQNGSGTAVSGDGRVVDTFQYIGWFQLTSENDTIFFSNDTKWKGAAPGEGDDTIVGGSGYEDLYYTVDTGRGISLNVLAGIVLDPWGDTDHFSAIEGFRGSQSADTMSAAGVSYAVNLEGNDGNDLIFGGNGADTLLGGSGDDKLYGGDGNDTIDDGVGFDTIDGGAGVDTFVRFYEGVDYSTVLGFDLNRGLAYAPSAPNTPAEVFVDIENLRVSGGYTFILTGSGANNTLESAAGNDSLYGLSGNDTLSSGDGNDLLDGGAGNDSLIGGLGSDTYLVDSSTDAIVELSNAGTDVARSSAATYTLAVNVENLTLTGSAAINGTGNSSNNILTGNTAANNLSGAGGNDTILGDAGNDTLDGGAGNDSLTGGTGDDTYIVDSSTDIVVEGGSAGTDLVQSSATTYTLSNNVENLTLTGSAAINGTGNTGNNILTGNSAANSISGGGGNDTIIGGGGNDTLEGAAGNDSLTGGDGVDTASYSGATAAVTVNLGTAAAQNTVGAGTDTLATIESLIGSAYNDTLTGDANANSLSGGAGNDNLTGGVGNDTLDGGAGNDVLTGGDGTDAASYASATAGVTVDLTLTAAQNTVGSGTDTLATIENVIGSKFNDLLTGTATVNQLEGGTGADTLVGGAGADLLYGGDGDDRFVIAAAADLATGEILNGGGGADELRFTSTTASTLALTSGVAVEKVVIGTGTTASADSSGVVALNVNAASAANGLSMLGNAGANTLTGSGYNDSIDGGSGNDSLTGGAGNDTVYGGLGNDTLVGGAGSDVFVFNTTPNASTNKDTISDFVSANDDIWLSKTAMAGLGSSTGQLSSAAFWSGAGVTASHDGDDRIIYNLSTGALYYDADGNGSTAAVQIAQLTANTALSYQDIFIV